MIALEALEVDGAGPYDAVLAPGARLGLIAANEGLATRLLEAIAGARRHSGRVLVDGRPRRPRDVAFAPQELDQVLFGRTAAEAIGPAGCLLAAAFGAEQLLGRPPQELSRGERRRLALAAAFGSQRPLLLLDRPTAGLDPQGQALFWQVAAQYAGALVLSLDHAAQAQRCSGLLAVPGVGGPLAGGPLSAERQRLVRWPPDAAADLIWTVGGGMPTDAREEVERWRARRRRR